MSEKVTVIVKGCGLKKNSGDLSGLQVFEREYRFDDPVEFGRFFGPKLVADKVDIQENDLMIPGEARYTWSVKRVEGADSDLYGKWAENFSDSKVGSRDLSKKEVLLYWLQRTQDEEIVEALS